MIKDLIFVFSLFYSTWLVAQDLVKLESYDGTYHLMKIERSVMPGKQGTNLKTLQVVEKNGTIMLATLECDKCTPSIFTYQNEPSEKLGNPVFFNSMGLYMIALDEDGFIYCMTQTKLGDGLWNSLIFSNFYSKDEIKVNEMNNDKLLKIAHLISKKAME